MNEERERWKEREGEIEREREGEKTHVRNKLNKRSHNDEH